MRRFIDSLATGIDYVCCYNLIEYINYFICVFEVKSDEISNKLYKFLTFPLFLSIFSTKNMNYMRLTGEIPCKKRQEIVEKFNRRSNSSTDVKDEINILFITSKVGSLGLNLIGADRVLIFDPVSNDNLT